ncbi:MAG: putative pre6S rRNA nuclease [Solirubrobacterales bacterium]|nr:putative pre6S rRNA nuclease [Solirubrobacterales bacterium]
MRILALDYGSARCGCAISDPTGTIATPLPALEPPEAKAVAELVERHEVELVVVGMPISLGGGEGPQAAVTREFCRELERLLDVPLETHDERFTTRQAERTARDGAVAAEDSLAAAHLLEAYLEAQAARRAREAKGDD